MRGRLNFFILLAWNLYLLQYSSNNILMLLMTQTFSFRYNSAQASNYCVILFVSLDHLKVKVRNSFKENIKCRNIKIEYRPLKFIPQLLSSSKRKFHIHQSGSVLCIERLPVQSLVRAHADLGTCGRQTINQCLSLT